MGEILSLEEMAPRVAELKARGKRIAFANGHFDVLHVGHLRYLRAAKQEGDVLVVAINDDESVALLKGQGRPIAPEQERAELVAALEPVDLVVIFSGDSPGPLMDRLQP
ncbi:MAG: adenylyltransferase/cytidyltransferase family protein, partial [Nitrospirae bacterium]|nr:adenylyltransferase/cytidyltransferase family protein [Nitrospirota bacterium]